MKITLPEGFKMPTDAKPGQPFEAVATLVMGEDGTMITALNGVALAEEMEGEEMEAEEMAEAEYAEPEVKIPFEM
jgi:hypothetical protein